MKIYYLTQSHRSGYDRYDSCVVIAKSEADARKIHPRDSPNEESIATPKSGDAWAPPDLVKVECIGVAQRGQRRGVVCASFNAG